MKKIIKAILRLIRHYIKDYLRNKRICSEQMREEFYNMVNVPVSMQGELSLSEKHDVEILWGSINPRLSFAEYGVFKELCGFDPRYMSHQTYLPLVARTLNNYRYTKLFEHKSLLGYLVNSSLKFPRCIIRCVDQEYYNEQMNQLMFEDVVSLCIREDVLIIKDSVDSAGGKSVEKLELCNLSEKDKKAQVIRVLNERNRDFVVQECVRQHHSTAIFNQSSINTFRITSLYLNGVFSILSIIFRFGKKGMNVDNWGSGGILIGVSSDGNLQDFGYDIQLNKYYEYSGIVFKNRVIEQIPSLLKQIECTHTSCFSLCKFIGWDVCFDEKNEPVIIELNSSQPGVFGEQICTGPIFGERTQEVIDYCKKKGFEY